jgi:aspartyl-tRNA(Asn)/glutamyl-tRNA(Gln) amidotransferase subunit A
MFSISKRPTIKEIHELYKNNKAKPSDVIKFFFNRNKEVDRDIKAFFSITEKIAINKSVEQDEILTNLIDSNKKTIDLEKWEDLVFRLPLFGIPFSIKAIILVEGEVFNAGSKILNDFVAPYSSTVYKQVDEAGAILLGVNNMDEFATGSSGESCSYGKTKNPFDITRVPGGSSSGSAASVASGQAVFSLGTDTGGSIRQPASFCDLVGLKPTYGLVSRYGVIPMASSLDQVGAFTNNVEDNILVTKVLSKKDENDQTSLDSQDLVKNLDKLILNLKNKRVLKNPTRTIKPLKIGIPKEFYGKGIDPQISSAMLELKNKLINLGHELIDISMPLSKYAISVYYMIMTVELAANLQRYDGLRFAEQFSSLKEKLQKDEQKNLKNLYSTDFLEKIKDTEFDIYYSQRAFFGEEVIRRILLGTYASSGGYYDAYYNHAQMDFDKAFEKCNLLLTPTTPEFPFKSGEKTNDPLKMYLSDALNCGINPVRIPGLSVPLGLFKVEDNDSNFVELPAGCQILGPDFSENLIFQLAQEIESIVKN